MIVKIEIDCNETSEVLTHLSVIRDSLKKAFKKDDDFKGRITDSNCYGSHSVEVYQYEVNPS